MNRLLKIIKEIRPDIDLDDSINFIEDGYLDSFDVVSVVSDIEEIFEIDIDALDILPENFMNLEAIKALIIKSGGKFES